MQISILLTLSDLIIMTQIDKLGSCVNSVLES